ncbi:response regulator [Dissulfurirhabdus thermomarina]|uniref:histidine kinase n=1 Tax=Dissulfurirhabdus thermomarina TaxID=1765737 RepID=A0A6N9TK67_DISTH|nr:response regulator [Dissulfurirhabdus thermomarina]NDY41479.1 response regulator [Dissulfurirhabdus thermomarina]NMX23894.1 response regulator [Dissulfurirhabdus thermomarina]
MKILIVDDNPVDRAFLRANVEKRGCEAVEAGNGLEGLEMATLHRPDVIVSDVLMPEMDGFEFLKAARRRPELRDIPFIFYSSVYTGDKEEDFARELGAAAFIRKPADPEALWARINAILQECRVKPAAPPPGAAPDETRFFKKYSGIVAARLEEKVRELEEAKARLEESERFYRNLFGSLRDVVIITDPDRRILDANQPALRETFGYEREEILGRDVGLLYEEPAPRGGESAPAVFGEPREGAAQVDFRRKDGGRFTGELHLQEMRDEDGRPLGKIGVIRDVSDRRRTERLIKKILESVGEGFVLIDPDYRIVCPNLAYCHLAGVADAESLKGRHCYEASHHSDRPCWERGEACPVKVTFETGEPHAVVHRHFDEDGRTGYVEVHSYPLRDDTGRIVSVIEIMNDITEKRELEEQLRHSQKIQAVGKLAGGIAHDFNNILTAIIGFGSLLQARMRPDDPLLSYVRQILASAEKAASLTQSLLAFSRKQVIQPEPVRLNTIIRNMEGLLARLVGEDIRVETDLSPADPTILADSGQIDQVLMNLAANARDAMPGGGVLHVATDVVTLDAEFVRARGRGQPGPHALLRVTDTGTGMTEEVKDRIFEPFFTTKDIGQGTGLGLAMVHGIVEQHKGHIDVRSTPGQGTEFSIYLPLSPVPAREPEAETDEVPEPGGETVLLAEDNPEVRTLLTEILQDYGYEVLLAEDGEEALEVFDRHRGEVDLLLFDLMMPRLGGREAFQAIQARKPGIRVVFISGYATDYAYKKGLLEKGAVFVSKPVSPNELLKAIREALDRAPTRREGAA